MWSELIGWEGDAHLSPFHLASYVLIGAGFWAIAAAWPVLLGATREGKLATTGLYARVRHPQYVGFLAIMVGFLLQWPTVPTLVMFQRRGTTTHAGRRGSSPDHPAITAPTTRAATRCRSGAAYPTPQL